MPATVDWPATRAFMGAQFSFGLSVSEALHRGVYTGLVTSRSNAADRLTCIVTLAPARDRDEQAQREGWVFNIRSQRLWVRFGFPHRPIPRGTLRGTPTATSPAAAGALTLSITTTAGATLLPGDMLGYGSNHVLMVGINGDTADGSGAMADVPLAFPLPAAISGSAALTWDNPKALWQWDGDGLQIDYTPGVIQQPLVLPFRQVINTA